MHLLLNAEILLQECWFVDKKSCIIITKTCLAQAWCSCSCTTGHIYSCINCPYVWCASQFLRVKFRSGNVWRNCGQN